MTIDEFIALRKAVGLNQKAWGEALGLSFRQVQEVERGGTALREIHVLAAERVGLRYAAERSQPMLAPASARRDALKVAQDILGGPPLPPKGA